MRNRHFLRALALISVLSILSFSISACQPGESTELVEQIAPEESLENTEEEVISTENEIVSDEEEVNKPTFNLVLVPVVPFFTYRDEISLDDIKAYWNGNIESLNYLTNENVAPELLLTEKTLDVLKTLLGQPDLSVPIKLLSQAGLLTYADSNPNVWSIISFESLEPKWKALDFPGMSIFDKELDLSSYPLTVKISVDEADELTKDLRSGLDDEELTNRDINYLTSLDMTGVTAMVRGTANRMEKMGILYPAEKIVDTLKNADITHNINNEVPFVEGCQGARDKERIFCSKPEYIELLKYIGADVIELTGNHMNDYGHQAFLDSLALYEKEGLPYFGGGKNLEDSYKPAVINSNRNKIAFLGFNWWGPPYALATKNTPGSAPPNFEDFEEIIRELKSQGYIVVFTFQYLETYSYKPTEQQIIDFRRMIDAGADIVSGSQAHQPMGVEFRGNGFINYGLGNLFFDQMFSLAVRQGIIAQHIFYKGKHISTKLITIMLEDYFQPRLTTEEERLDLLRSIFEGSLK